MGEKAHSPHLLLRELGKQEEQENPATDEDRANRRTWKKRY
jgi:hypothetical protein